MKRRRALARVALALGTLVVSLAVAEVAFRVALAPDDSPARYDDGGWRERYIRMNETIYRRSGEAALVYEPTPGASVQMEYGVAGFNAAGMRDTREHALEAPPGERRVSVIGDSLVWSEFLALEDSVPRRLEESLGGEAAAFNFGVTGYDLAQSARWYERAARPFAAPSVVVVFCMNDLMIMSGPYGRFADAAQEAAKRAQDEHMRRVAPVRRETIDHVLAEREREALSVVLARASALFVRWRYAQNYNDEYLVAFADEARRERAGEAIARLGAAIAEDGAEGLLVISPVLESWDHYHWDALHTFVRARAEAAGLTVLDPLEAWRAEGLAPDTLRVPGDNLHYGAEGARRLGRAIADRLEEAPFSERSP